MKDFRSELDYQKGWLDRKRAQYDACREIHFREYKQIDVIKQRQQNLEEAQAFAQHVAQHVQSEAHRRVAEVVNHSLSVVFDDPYEFKIHFEQKRNRTEARLVFCRNGIEVDPLSASGGGVIDVAAFTLRLSCLILRRPRVRKVLILDEPFKNVSTEYLPRVRSLVESLSEEMNIQIIMVTHMDHLKMGEVVKLARPGSRSGDGK